MKKNLFICLLLSTLYSNAQGISDALRYAQENPQGTARFNAMGGAFGAIGGDLSAMSINPAGGAVFTSSQFAVSLGNFNTSNSSSYFGTTSSDSGNRFDLNQLGTVVPIRNYDPKSDWKRFSFGVNYDLVNSFNNSTSVTGTNPYHSIADYFTYYANLLGGIPLSNLQASSYYFPDFAYMDQQAWLGYNGYLINPAVGNPASNNLYDPAIKGGNYRQTNTVNNTGYNGKLAFNFSGQVYDWMYVGINLNSYFNDYKQSSRFSESNPNGNPNVNGFYQDLHTYGNGFSFQLGTIIKITKEFRVGANYTSPVWYRFTDELSQRLNTSSAAVNPGYTMVFEPYKLQTPQSFLLSAAYVYNKQGIISVDYGVKEYSDMRFKPKNQFSDVNSAMDKQFTTSNSFRVGWEHKIKHLSVRAGYRWEQSPYIDKSVMGDLTGYSTGFGYHFQDYKIDVAYSYTQQDYQLSLLSAGVTETALTKVKNNAVTATFTYIFR
ncbi:MAG: transporter [Flavobacterium sp. BFFFF2]|nr:MAG: transporter [Flavobacterium sp. BFFFF2]